MVVMVWVRSPVYFYKRNQTYYFSRAIPSGLRHRFNRPKIEVSLRTKSKLKAAQSAASLSDRLKRYWDSLRMEMIYSRELGLSIKPQAGNGAGVEVTLSNALALYHRLKGVGRSKLFFETSERNIRYLKECNSYPRVVKGFVQTLLAILTGRECITGSRISIFARPFVINAVWHVDLGSL